MSIFGAPKLHSRGGEGDRHVRPLGFFVGNLVLSNLYFKHFLIKLVFFAVFSLKNLLTHLFTLINRQYLGFLVL